MHSIRFMLVKRPLLYIRRYEKGAFQSNLEISADGMLIFGGNEEFLLTGTLDDGPYGIGADGSQTPIIMWEEGRISVVGLRGIVPSIYIGANCRITGINR